MMLYLLSGEKKTSVIPKVLWRKIGGVNIFELYGIFSEPWLNRSKEEMLDVLDLSPSPALLLDLRLVEKVDHSGSELILETARKAQKGGILGRNLSSYFVAEHMRPHEPIPIFEDEREAIEYFGKEFALPNENSKRPSEKRDFFRIKTALPVEFELKVERNKFLFEVVVLNLSEGGLYGRFLDSKTEELAQRVLDPFDLRMLTIRLRLDGNQTIKTDGKVLRMEGEPSAPGAVAVKFYNLESGDREKLQKFLGRARVQ